MVALRGSVSLLLCVYAASVCFQSKYFEQKYFATFYLHQDAEKSSKGQLQTCGAAKGHAKLTRRRASEAGSSLRKLGAAE